MQPSQNLPGQLKTVQVVVRFVLRLAVLVLFAMFAGAGFAGSMVALSWMSAVLCAVAAVMRRERPFRDDLNHWDEMTAYMALCALAGRFALAPV